MKCLQTELTNKATTLETLAQQVVSQPELLSEVFEGLGAQKARIKYGCLKLLRILSETKPDLLYPEMDKLFDLLESENNILKWGAIIIIGNLAAVDSESRIDGILGRYLQPIAGPVMITAANVIGGAGRIAQAKPYLADRIARALLQVEEANYQTAECRNVALGHAVESLDLFFEHLKQPQPVVEFVQRQLNNDRAAVQRKATRFLKRHAQPAKTAGARAKSPLK